MIFPLLKDGSFMFVIVETGVIDINFFVNICVMTRKQIHILRTHS
jgi:hypothetical protein